MQKFYLGIFLVCAFLASTKGTGLAQSDTKATALPDSSAIAEVLGDATAMVKLRSKELFLVHGESFVSAKDRADGISEAVLAVAESVKLSPSDLRIVRDERVTATLIMCDRVFLAAVWAYEAEAMNLSQEELATERMEIIRDALKQYRNDFSSGSMITAIIYSAGATILLVVLITLIVRLRQRLESSLVDRVGQRTLFKVLKGEALIDAIGAINRIVQFFAISWLVLIYLNFLLSRFPWTYGIASQVYSLAAGPLRAFGTAMLEQIPSLFFLAFIIVLTTFILRGIRFFFREIERERIRINGFYAEWSRPTFNLIRLVVIAFSIVVAFPYIPGSGSGAFKGVTLFMGLLVSLGSGSAMANIVSGIILIYMRPFSVGDRIRIGEAFGDVVDRNLLTTRIRTPKNERVTIPNTNILSGQIINYTSNARTTELIVHTEITIGYDVPWRDVHAMMIDAAGRTENILDEPKPYVLQTALNDFYVEYQINGFTDKPRATPTTYSELRQ
ncbi:MAG: small-conductance mechanosensitive channel, partial [Candidatus Krumholzibacteriia bacterium]